MDIESSQQESSDQGDEQKNLQLKLQPILGRVLYNRFFYLANEHLQLHSNIKPSLECIQKLKQININVTFYYDDSNLKQSKESQYIYNELQSFPKPCLICEVEHCINARSESLAPSPQFPFGHIQNLFLHVLQFHYKFIKQQPVYNTYLYNSALQNISFSFTKKKRNCKQPLEKNTDDIFISQQACHKVLRDIQPHLSRLFTCKYEFKQQNKQMHDKLKMQGIDQNQQKQQIRDLFKAKKIKLYHSVNALKEIDIDSEELFIESEDDIDESALTDLKVKQINEFEHVSQTDKQFFIMWNIFMTEYTAKHKTPIFKGEMYQIVKQFASGANKHSLQKELRNNFINDYDELDQDQIFEILAKLNNKIKQIKQ